MSTIETPFEKVIDRLATSTRLIANLPLVLPSLALTNIQQMLDSLMTHPPTQDVYLETLERLRHPLSVALQGQMQHYRDKPLPLMQHGAVVFQQTIAILCKMCDAYQHCAQCMDGAPHDEDSPEYRRLLALTLHRSLYYASAFIHEHYHARQELPPDAWLKIHRYYAEAELREVAQTPVMDPLENEEVASCCATLYIVLLLVEIANPYTYDARDQYLIHHWAKLWAPLVSIHPLESLLEIPPFIVDLAEDRGLHPATDGVAGNDARYLDTFGLTAQISETREKLSRSPGDPALMETLRLGDTRASHAKRLLSRLANPWGLTVSPRRFHRYAIHDQLELCSGFEYMHQAILGAKFKQPDTLATGQGSNPDAGGAGPDPDLMAPGAAPTQPKEHEAVLFPTSTWDILNYSANGFRLFRAAAGLRVAHKRLLALCPRNSQHYLLGEACWLMQDQHKGCLHLGIAMLPGIPQAVTVRPADEGNAPYARAFWLPGLGKTDVPALVLPIGMYRFQRGVFLAQADNLLCVTLDRRWKYGLDFEVVSYTQS
jgi:hypothetical protein